MEETGSYRVQMLITDETYAGEVIKKPDYYKNHFRLTGEKREFLETILDVTI